MYPITAIDIAQFPPGRKVSELKCVQPMTYQYLADLGYAVDPEAKAFMVPYSRTGMGKRPDFLATKEREVMIVECKGCPISEAQVFSAVLQLTMYIRLYKLAQRAPYIQPFFESINPGFIEMKAELHGILVLPAAAVIPKIKDALERIYRSLSLVELDESPIDIWEINADPTVELPKRKPRPRHQNESLENRSIFDE